MYLVPKTDKLIKLEESYQSNTTAYLNLVAGQIWVLKDIKHGLIERPYEYLCVICLEDESAFAVGLPAGLIVDMFDIYNDKHKLVESSESFHDICRNWTNT